MKTIILNDNDIKRLIYKNNYIYGTYTYNCDGILYKFKREFCDDYKNNIKSIKKDYGISKEKIEWLSSKQKDIKNSVLPFGIIEYNSIIVGVVYPNSFIGYYDFNNLHNENNDVIFDNMKKSTYNNIELMLNGIYNTDLLNRKILYDKNEVNFIGLDGKYIKSERFSNAREVHIYYLYELKKIILRKISNQYSIEEFDKLKSEVDSIFSLNNVISDAIDYPLRVINEVENKHILKQ